MIHPLDALRPTPQKTQTQPVGETAASWFALGVLAMGFMMLMKRQDKLEGGLGDSLLERDVDPRELAKGQKVEREHTTDPSIATEIALDHLAEDPHYYSHLSLMEAKYKGQYRGNPLKLKEWDEYASRVADAYDARPSMEEKYLPSWDALMKHIEKMFRRMESKITVEFVEEDPYKNTQEIIDDIEKNKRLKVYSGHAEHPVWSVEQNLKFRAYHDYLSHVAGGHSFGLKGEIASYNQHAKMAPKRALLALFTEIVGQAMTAVKRGKFPEQKICKLHGFDYYNLGEIDEAEYKKNFTRKNPHTVKGQTYKEVFKRYLLKKKGYSGLLGVIANDIETGETKFLFNAHASCAMEQPNARFPEKFFVQAYPIDSLKPEYQRPHEPCAWGEECPEYEYFKAKFTKENPIPPASVAREAREGLALRSSVAPSRRGGTEVGIARAKQLANRQNISESTMKRMKSYFARHEIDKKAEGFAKGEKGYPSKGLQAWKLWGGDSGAKWVKKKV